MNIINQLTAKKQVINLYKDLGWKSLFAKIRFWDAPFIEVEKLVPAKGKIIELGCGEGLFSNFLALVSPKRNILGIEIDENRLEIADRGLENVSFELGDAVKCKLYPCDCVVFFHLLHHLNSLQDQERVLRRYVQVLNEKGKLILVEVEPQYSLRYLAAWFVDHFLVPWIFEKKLYSPIFFRSKKQWLSLLYSLGLYCQVIDAGKGKPFSHLIFNCQK